MERHEPITDPPVPVPSRIPDDHPVLELLRERLDSASTPGERDDPYRLGLVVEGGGMRGVVSGGMLAGLEQMGAVRGFDAVYGASAGAVGAPFFLAGQAIYGLEIYYAHLNDGGFISYRRALTGSPVLSLDYLLETLLQGDKRLDVDRALGHPVELKIAASAIDRQRCELLEGFGSPEALYEALRAAVSLPFVTGNPVEIDGRRFMDTAVTQPIPYPAALADGCTHLLCLLSRPAGTEDRAPNIWKRVTFGRALRGLSDQLAALYEDRAYLYDALVQELTWSTEDPGDEPPYLCGLAVRTEEAEVGSFERDTDELLRGGKAGYTSAVQLLTEREVETVVALRAVDPHGRVIPPRGGGPGA